MSDDIVRVPVTEKYFVGIDASLTSTGFCIKMGSEIRTETIKTKPEKFKNDLERLEYIAKELLKRIPKGITMVAMEDFYVAFNKAQINSSIRLAMLATTVRLSLYDVGIPFFIVSPSTLKKHILGKGVGEKDLILREVYKKLGLSPANNDEADAVVLCHIAEHLHQSLSGTLGDIPKYQKEAIKAILDARDERSYNIHQ